LPAIELDHAVSNIKITIVMTDDDNGFASSLQFEQELIVKDVFEYRVLVGGPFIENIDGAILQVGG